jgi:hypothetical protein
MKRRFGDEALREIEHWKLSESEGLRLDFGNHDEQRQAMRELRAISALIRACGKANINMGEILDDDNRRIAEAILRVREVEKRRNK